MRILISSYSPQTVTSYGTITRELWTRLMGLMREQRHEVIQHAWFHSPALPPVEWQVVPTRTIEEDGVVSGDPKDEYGQKSCAAILQKFRPDVVWSLSDIYMSSYLDRLKDQYGFKLIRWTLSAGDPVRPDDIKSVRAADRCVGITQYSTDLWKDKTRKSYEYIYHGVDTNVFTAVPPERRAELRKEFLKESPTHIGSDDFGILYVGRNQGRKRPWLLFQALHYLMTGNWGWIDGKPVLGPWDERKRTSRKPDNLDEEPVPINAFVWMHSFDDGTRYAYRELADYWRVSSRTFFTGNLSHVSGLLPNAMANVYQACNVLSMMSGSEGFGVPIIEAAACGIPCVYTNYAGTGEIGKICSGRGIPYTGWEPMVKSALRWVYPDIAAGVAALYSIHTNRKKYDDPAVRDALRATAEKNFNWDRITLQWAKVIDEVGGQESRRVLGGVV